MSSSVVKGAFCSREVRPVMWVAFKKTDELRRHGKLRTSSSRDPGAEEKLVDEARALAASIIEEAHLRARDILTEAQAEANRIKDEAHREGYRAGYERGWAEGVEGCKREAKAIVVSAQQVLDQAIKDREKFLEESKGDIARLAVEVAKRIIDIEVSTTPEMVVQIAARAISRLKSSQTVVLKVNPASVAVVESAIETLEASCPGVKVDSVIGDSRVEPGGCIVEAEEGVVDATLETQLRKIETAVAGALKDGY